MGLGHQPDEVASDHFRSRVAKHALSRAIERKHLAVLVDGQNAIDHRIQYGLRELLFLTLLQGAFDCRGEAFQTLLVDVVHRPRLQALHRFLRAQISRHHQHRGAGLLLPGQYHRREAVVAGEIVVAQHHVVDAVGQCGFVLLAAGRAHDVTHHAGGLQRVLKQIRIVRIVFQNQDAQHRRGFGHGVGKIRFSFRRAQNGAGFRAGVH